MASSTPSAVEAAAPTPATLLPKLRAAFPKGYFPDEFHWECLCGTKGFPGCSNLEHFCRRVYLYILDRHQLADSQARGLVRRQPNPYGGGTDLQLVDPAQLSRKYKRLLNRDTATALRVLRKAGVLFR